VVRVKIDDDENRVAAVCAALRVTEQLVVVDGPKLERVVALQGSVLAPRSVQARQEPS
jgi:hypothetical protein